MDLAEGSASVDSVVSERWLDSVASERWLAEPSLALRERRVGVVPEGGPAWPAEPWAAVRVRRVVAGAVLVPVPVPVSVPVPLSVAVPLSAPAPAVVWLAEPSLAERVRRTGRSPAARVGRSPAAREGR
ncbi:hypothetical protein, partial [Streptomyces acidicola]|uniref:hypothetical protein n=1 Tax=Streptomyces acidicola TaxID=2596892 RepID=UPI00188431F7